MKPAQWQHIERGDSIPKVQLRELREETGIVSNDLTFIHAQSNMETLSIMGFCVSPTVQRIQLYCKEGETISYRWLSKAEFLALLTAQNLWRHSENRWLPFLDRII